MSNLQNLINKSYPIVSVGIAGRRAQRILAIVLVENATEKYIHFRKLYQEICANVKQSYIATYLGIAPKSLSRIRKAMKETEYSDA